MISVRPGIDWRAVERLRAIAERAHRARNSSAVTPDARSSCVGMQLGENHRPILAQDPRRAADHLRLRPLDVHLDEPHRPPEVERRRARRAAPPSSGCPASGAVPSRSRYAPPEFSVSTGNVSVADPGRRADGGALKDDAIAEPVLGNRPLEQIGVRVERLERVDAPRGPDRRRHLHREEADVRADVDRGVARPQHAAHEPRSRPARTWPRRMFRPMTWSERSTNSRTPASISLITTVRIVGVREVGVLLAELGRRHQMVPEFRRVA